ncbi:MAG: MFS transporter [Janthinobacterium lividum]
MSNSIPLQTGAVVRASPWWRIGVSLFVGLFVAYLDRTNLSVALPSLSQDLGFAGPRFATVSSWALTIFLIGYALANVLGGLLTRRYDPKPVVIWCVAIWSVATVIVGFTDAVAVLLVCRFVLGVTEGVYWPQQSRFARAWFAPEDRTTANTLIQYYGQFLALAFGFVALTPIYDAFGWRILFFVTGGLGLFLVVPLYAATLGSERDAPFHDTPAVLPAPERLTLASLGGPPFLLLVFSYLTQGMLFWGITLWIPLAVRSLGFTGFSQAMASAVPYVMAVLLAYPIARLSDRTNQRVLIAALGLLIPGILMVTLAFVDSGWAKMALITVALGYYAASFTPNIWSIIQSSVRPQVVGPAAGIINGVGAGGGGTAAGFLVGMLYGSTGSYIPGFVLLGGLVILGGMSLLTYRHVTRQAPSIL